MGTVHRFPVAQMAPPSMENRLKTFCWRMRATMAPSTQIPTSSLPSSADTHAHNKLEEHAITRLVLLDRDEITTEEEDGGADSKESNERITLATKN